MPKLQTQSRKFHPAEFYRSSNRNYYLLPFSFMSLSDKKEVIVNFSGDFLIVPKGTANAIANKNIDKSSPLFNDLLVNFFIAEDPYSPLLDILAVRYRTKKSFIDDFTSLHIFVVTLRCNHTCHYCQVSRVTENEQQFDMSTDNLRSAIDLMFNSPSQHLTVEFQGGEPLLAFDKIRFAVETILEINRDQKRQIRFVICTNSTIGDESIFSFCRKHNIVISTSLDGPEEIHNANRRKSGANSYQEVLRGITQWRQNLGFDKVSALMTTSSVSLSHSKGIIDEYVNNGFKNIFLRPISPYGFALKAQKLNNYQDERFLEFYMQGLFYILELNQKGVFIAEDYATILLKKMLTPFPVGYVDLQSPSGLINNVLVYNYDGNVYASDESRMLAEMGDFTFRLGHVTDSYIDIVNGLAAKQIRQHSVNEALAGCSECAFQLYCGADPVFHYATQGEMEGYRPSSSFCKRNMDIIKLLLNLIDERPEVLKIFYSWIRYAN